MKEKEVDFKLRLDNIIGEICDVMDINATASNAFKKGLGIDPSNYHRWLGKKAIPPKQQDILFAKFGISKEYMNTGKGEIRTGGTTYISNPAKIEILGQLADSRKQTIDLLEERFKNLQNNESRLKQALTVVKEKFSEDKKWKELPNWIQEI